MTSRKVVKAAVDFLDPSVISGGGFTDEPLKESAPVEIPDAIIKLAQMAYDGQEVKGKVVHTVNKRFKDEGTAEAFAVLIKAAADRTDPPCSIAVTLDPKNDDDKCLVRFRAGKRRGRKNSDSEAAPTAA